METANQLLGLVTSPWIAYTVYAGLKLGLVDAAASGEVHLPTLSRKSGIDEKLVERLAKALVNIGVFRSTSTESYALTSMAAPLADPESEFRSWNVLWSELFTPAWRVLPDRLMSGGSVPFERVHGTNIFQFLGQRPDLAEHFDRAMAGLSRRLYAQLPASYDFGQHRVVVDVGGGTGGLLAQLLSQHPHLHGVLLERPETIPGAERLLEAAGLKQRCDLVPGNFFEGVPAGGDAYVLANVIHDWNDRDAVNILRTVRSAIGTASATLLLLELALDDVTEPKLARMTDMNMLVLTGGRERTRTEFESLLDEGGFELSRTKQLGDLTCLLTARPK